MAVLHTLAVGGYCSGASSTSANLHSKLSWESTSPSKLLSCPSAALNFFGRINTMLMPRSPCNRLSNSTLKVSVFSSSSPSYSIYSSPYSYVQSSCLPVLRSPIWSSADVDLSWARLVRCPDHVKDTRCGLTLPIQSYFQFTFTFTPTAQNYPNRNGCSWSLISLPCDSSASARGKGYVVTEGGFSASFSLPAIIPSCMTSLKTTQLLVEWFQELCHLQYCLPLSSFGLGSLWGVSIAFCSNISSNRASTLVKSKEYTLFYAGLFGTNPPVNGGDFWSFGGFVRALQLMGCFNFAISATATSLSSELSVPSSDSTSTRCTEEDGIL
ncbi:unnamed protein product [Prunus armeniaca]